jgi:hypothetical protein
MDKQRVEVLEHQMAYLEEGLGAPGDSRGGCHNRDQARSWYKSAFGRGVRATVNEIMPGPTRLLVGLAISGSRTAR